MNQKINSISSMVSIVSMVRKINIKKGFRMGLVYFILTGLFIISTNSYGGESKYDSQVSKYDLGLQSVRYTFDEQSNKCVETALKEREAVIADVKSGRFKVKLHPDYKDVLLLSNDFSREKEFVYYGSSTSCVKHNRDRMVENIKNLSNEDARRYYYGN